MPYGLYISAQGAFAQSQRIDTLANNMANVDTAGFKRDLAIFQSRYAQETEQGRDYYGSRSVNDLGAGVKLRETKIDFSPGTLKHTGIPTDLAISSDAFFQVRRPDGDYLTRAGNFMFSPTGRLVTQDNDPVLSDSGGTIDIDPAGPAPTFSSDGGVSQGGDKINLALVRPQSLGDLVKVGENLFQALGPTQAADSEQRHIQTGMLEQSAVRPTSEMMQLIEASRAFEANINMIKNQDAMATALTQRLLLANNA